MSKKELSIKILSFLGTAIGLTFMLIAVCIIDTSVFVIEKVVKYLRDRKARKENETTTGGMMVKLGLPAFLFGASTHFKHAPFINPLEFICNKFPRAEEFITQFVPVGKLKLYQLDTE